jgi:hypothetical protein
VRACPDNRAIEIAFGVIVGVASGLVASLIFWWFQFRVFRVRLELSPTVSKYRFRDEEYSRYQVKLKNRSRRDGLDVRVIVRCAIPGLVRRGTIEVLTLDERSYPVVRARKYMRLRIEPGRMPEQTRTAYSSYFAPSMRAALESGQSIDLEQFLALRAESELRVYVSATDSLSGARSFVPREYSQGDIRVGRFREFSFEQTGVLEDDRDEPPA